MTRILIVGAGATGGALGARLVTAGQDVTFLVRERRSAQLATDGLSFRAPDANMALRVRAVTSVDGIAPFDLVVVAVKAPALPQVVSALAPAVRAETYVVPLLNGMAHVDSLAAAFPRQVLGGIAKIVATIEDDASIVQMTSLCSLTVGSLSTDGVPDDIVTALSAEGIALEVVDDITARLWEKWAFIVAAGVVTCLFRGAVGDILAAGGRAAIVDAIAECEEVATAAGFPPSAAARAQSSALLTEPGSAFTSSLYRDLQKGDPVEAEHIVGDFASRARALDVSTPLLDAALLQLRTHHQTTRRTANPMAPSERRNTGS